MKISRKLLRIRGTKKCRGSIICKENKCRKSRGIILFISVMINYLEIFKIRNKKLVMKFKGEYGNLYVKLHMAITIDKSLKKVEK